LTVKNTADVPHHRC